MEFCSTLVPLVSPSGRYLEGCMPESNIILETYSRQHKCCINVMPIDDGIVYSINIFFSYTDIKVILVT